MPKEKNNLLEQYKKLKRGDVSKIAKNMKVSRRTVWSVANGRFLNKGVALAIRKVANRREEENKENLRALEQAI